MVKRFGFLVILSILVLFIALPITGFLSLVIINTVLKLSVLVDYANSWLVGFLYFQIASAIKLSDNLLTKDN